jgi:hypothetical protein
VSNWGRRPFSRRVRESEDLADLIEFGGHLLQDKRVGDPGMETESLGGGKGHAVFDLLQGFGFESGLLDDAIGAKGHAVDGIDQRSVMIENQGDLFHLFSIDSCFLWRSLPRP